MLSSFHGNPPTPSSEQLHIEGPAQHRLDQSRFGTSFDERTCEYIFVESVQPTHPYFWLLLQMSIFHFVASKYSTNIVYTSQCWPTFTWFASLFQSFLPLHLGGEAPASSHCRSRFRRWCNSVTRRFRMSPPWVSEKGLSKGTYSLTKKGLPNKTIFANTTDFLWRKPKCLSSTCDPKPDLMPVVSLGSIYLLLPDQVEASSTNNNFPVCFKNTLHLSSFFWLRVISLSTTTTTTTATTTSTTTAKTKNQGRFQCSSWTTWSMKSVNPLKCTLNYHIMMIYDIC